MLIKIIQEFSIVYTIQIIVKIFNNENSIFQNIFYKPNSIFYKQK